MDIIASLREGWRTRQGMARRAGDHPQPLVQRQRRRRVLPLPPLLERRPVDAVRGASRLHPPRQGGRDARAAGAKLLAERRQLVADYRELLDTDEDRATYDQLIGLAHRVFPYVEGHKFYCEHWYTNLFFNKIREFGALLAEHGFFADAEDVFQLTQYELESRDRRPDDVAGRRGRRRAARALAGERRRAPGGDRSNGPSTRPRRRSARCPTSSTTRRSSCCGASRARASTPGWPRAKVAIRTRSTASPHPVAWSKARHGWSQRRGDLAAPAGRHPRLPGDQPDLGADLPEDRRRGLRHRRLDEPRGHRRARVRTARGGRHRQRHVPDQGRPAHPRRRRTRDRDDPAVTNR